MYYNTDVHAIGMHALRMYYLDLLLCKHGELLPQGGKLSVLLRTLLFNNVLHLHCLLSGSTFTIKVFTILLQLM